MLLLVFGGAWLLFMIIFLLIFVLPLYLIPFSGASFFALFLARQTKPGSKSEEEENALDDEQKEVEEPTSSFNKSFISGFFLAILSTILIAYFLSTSLPDELLKILVYNTNLIDNEIWAKRMIITGLVYLAVPIGIGLLFLSQKSRREDFVFWGRGALFSFWILNPIFLANFLLQAAGHVWDAVIPNV